MSRTTIFVITAALLGAAALVFAPKSPHAAPNPFRTAAPPPEPRLIVHEPVGAPQVEVARVNTAAVAQTVSADAAAPVEMLARISHPALTAGLSDVYAQIDLTARQLERGQRQPVNLAVVIDRSGSMHGDKLTRAKQAALHLINQLQPTDRLAVVHYGGDVASMNSLAGTESNKAQLRAFVDAIHDDGDTNIGAGLTEASTRLREHVKAFGVSRIILLSDGQPTSGLVSPSALTGLVEQLRGQGLTVSAIGVGSDFNENLMSAMANTGGGFYGFIDNSERLAEVFGRELDQASSTVARNVELTLEVPEGVTVVNVFGHNVAAGSRVVRLPLYDLSGGQTARVLARLSARAPSGNGQIPMVKATLRYTDVKAKVARSAESSTVAELVADRPAMDARVDRDVMVAGVRAMGAMMVTQAAQAYESGRVEEASGMFDNVRRLFGSSADALGGDPTLVAASKDTWGYQNTLKNSSGAQLKNNVKALQKKGLRDFGNSNTY